MKALAKPPTQAKTGLEWAAGHRPGAGWDAEAAAELRSAGQTRASVPTQAKTGLEWATRDCAIVPHGAIKAFTWVSLSVAPLPLLL